MFHLFLFAWVLLSYSRFFPLRDVTITGEGFQVLTYARQSGPLSCEDYLVCHGPIVHNGHLRGPATLTPVAERLAGFLLQSL